MHLPPELDRFSDLPDLKYRGNNEWSAAHVGCPVGPGLHGGPSDRLRLFGAGNGTNARVWCRRCNWFEWADQESPTPLMRLKATSLQRQYAHRESQRLSRRIKELQERAYWRGYHDAMQDSQRKQWRSEGISDDLQDYFQLGYTPDRTFSNGEQTFHSPALTIPIFDKGWEAINIQYRLLNPPEGAGKYRFTAGLPAPLYLTDPDNGIGGKCLLVEGAKKAIVTYANVGHEFDSVVAVPSKMPPASMLDKLSACDMVYVALDPDAYDDESARRLGTLISPPVRYVRLPVKPDDLFVRYGGEAKDFMSFVQQSTALC